MAQLVAVHSQSREYLNESRHELEDQRFAMSAAELDQFDKHQLEVVRFLLELADRNEGCVAQ